MIFRYLSVALVLAATSPIINAQGRSDSRPVKPWDDIGSAVAAEAANSKATFTISASDVDFGTDAILDPNETAHIEESLFTFEVTVANSAVTPDTILLDDSGNYERVGETAYSLLVASPSDREDGTMALLSVDHKTGVAKGIVQKKGQNAMHIQQNKGRSITAEKEPEFVPPAWACDVEAEHTDDPIRHRHLTEDHHEDHHHDHDHHHHHHHHEHEHGLDESDLSIGVENLRKSLRGSDIMNKRRKLQDSNAPYNFQIDLYIEIDDEFVSNNGGDLGAAYAYVNTLITFSNTIYEPEADTHLNVVQIERTNRYNSAQRPIDALNIMRQKWGGSSNWGPANVDLHTLLMGKDLRGGVAYVGVVCNNQYGLAVSASIKGGFSGGPNAQMVWDSMVTTHELGHNLNSGHTFDPDYYDPPVDDCPNSCSNIKEDTTTIMSYCHMCPGGFNNVANTFGGTYNKSGNNNLSSWAFSDKLVPGGSQNPQRVPRTMRQHVSTRGSCVWPDVPVPAGPTQKPSPAPTKAPSPPTTPRPTIQPDIAEYDTSLKAPLCDKATSHCSSGPSILKGRGTAAGGNEPNQSNTLDSCADGSNGSYKNDESVESLDLKTVEGGYFAAGAEVEITAEVWAWGNGGKDYADFWFAKDASNPVWEYITTKQPTRGDLSKIKANFDLPKSSTRQAIRVCFRYSQSNNGSPASACVGGPWTDCDDLAFSTAESEELFAPTSSPTHAPTPKPTPSPTHVPTSAPTKSPSSSSTTASPTHVPTSAPTKSPSTPLGPDASTSYLLACGSSSSSSCTGQTAAANEADDHEVRCCRDSAASGWVQPSTRDDICSDVWGRSRDANSVCQDALNHEEASAMCAEMGGRLCTAEELLGDCTRDTGCGHNHDLIWSSTEAPPDAGNTDTGSEAEGKKRKKGGGKKKRKKHED